MNLTLLFSGIAAIAGILSATWLITRDLTNKPKLRIDSCWIDSWVFNAKKNKTYRLNLRIKNKGRQTVQIEQIWYEANQEKHYLFKLWSNDTNYSILINPKSYEEISTTDLSILFNLKESHFYITDYYKNIYSFKKKILAEVAEDARKMNLYKTLIDKHESQGNLFVWQS